MITTVDIDRKLWERAKILAAVRGSSLKEIINAALAEYIKEHGFKLIKTDRKPNKP